MCFVRESVKRYVHGKGNKVTMYPEKFGVGM